jgi:hypothetical protein
METTSIQPTCAKWELMYERHCLISLPLLIRCDGHFLVIQGLLLFREQTAWLGLAQLGMAL